MTRIIDISPISFHEKILHSETPVVVEFFSHSCPHCIRFGPVYQELSKILTKEAGFFRIDVLLSDESRELAHSRGVHTVPTIEVFYRGRVIGSLTGYHHIKKVLGAVKESLARKDEYIGPGTPLHEPQTGHEKEEEVKLSLEDCQIRWCKKARLTDKDRRILRKHLRGMTRMIEEAMNYCKKQPVEEVRFSVIPGAFVVIEYCKDSWHLGLETNEDYLGEIVGKGMPLICLLEDNAIETENLQEPGNRGS